MGSRYPDIYPRSWAASHSHLTPEETKARGGEVACSRVITGRGRGRRDIRQRPLNPALPPDVDLFSLSCFHYVSCGCLSLKHNFPNLGVLGCVVIPRLQAATLTRLVLRCRESWGGGEGKAACRSWGGGGGCPRCPASCRLPSPVDTQHTGQFPSA